MYLTHSGKAKAALGCLAAPSAQLGNFHFRSDAARRTPPAVHHSLQEVTMNPVPAPKGKAAVAAAASWQLLRNCSIVNPSYHPFAELRPAFAPFSPHFPRSDSTCT